MKADDPGAPVAHGGGLLYLYGIVRAAPLPSPVSAADATIGFVVRDGVAALVESVPADEFSPDALEQHLGEVEWVAKVARKHEATLEAIMQAGPVIPARLCTLFTNGEAVERLLSERAGDFEKTLERITDAEEWGVKVYCDEASLRRHAAGTDSVARALGEAAATASPGQAHVLRKKREARIAEVASARMAEIADRVLDRIEELDVDTCLRKLLPEAATHRKEKMILNVAVLVRAEDVDRFFVTLDGLVEELSGIGFVLDRSGPFPAYSFTRGDSQEEEPS